MPQPFKDAAKNIGAKAASKLATPSTVALKMSQEMPKKMPQEMGEKGMTVHAETVFQEGALNVPYCTIALWKCEKLLLIHYYRFSRIG